MVWQCTKHNVVEGDSPQSGDRSKVAKILKSLSDFIQ